jgi:hypothetical protein
VNAPDAMQMSDQASTIDLSTVRDATSLYHVNSVQIIGFIEKLIDLEISWESDEIDAD